MSVSRVYGISLVDSGITNLEFGNLLIFHIFKFNFLPYKNIKISSITQ